MKDKITKKFEQRHLRDLKKYQKQVLRAYHKAIDKIFVSATGKKMASPTFKISQYPTLKKLVDNVLEEMTEEINILILNGVKEQWGLSETKNDELISELHAGRTLSPIIREAIYTRNDEAMNAFIRRANSDGLQLSERIWNYTDQFRTEIEQGLYVGLSEGMPAAKMATQQKQYLVDPDKLFRRVRNTKGKLVLSKAAKAYKPGQGKYRSSYKNALRVTVSETNMSYRSADNDRYARSKFILGVEIRLSANHPKFDICDHMKGNYPSSFKFVGWHPFCICYTVPILPSPDEYDKYEEAILDGRGDKFQFKNPVKNVPSNFTKYVETNKDMLKGLKSTPYWVRDNKVKI